ncbi:hypothetical protein [Commensalibacter melissae]|uniref:hypothetical protein n=1 Tax=Commensalibacter melissae TaxID=2070537 RepID=UPI001E5254C7|nr:hypothetical protein [Commensalibacter melissae]
MILAITSPVGKNWKQYGNSAISMESPDTMAGTILFLTGSMTGSISAIQISMPIFPWVIKKIGKQ